MGDVQSAQRDLPFSLKRLLEEFNLLHLVRLCLDCSLVPLTLTMPEQMEISAAAKSGDGTLEKVGIKVDGKFKSPVTNQWFDTREALDLHLKYLHDPKKASTIEE